MVGDLEEKDFIPNTGGRLLVSVIHAENVFRDKEYIFMSDGNPWFFTSVFGAEGVGIMVSQAPTNTYSTIKVGIYHYRERLRCKDWNWSRLKYLWSVDTGSLRASESSSYGTNIPGCTRLLLYTLRTNIEDLFTYNFSERGGLWKMGEGAPYWRCAIGSAPWRVFHCNIGN